MFFGRRGAAPGDVLDISPGPDLSAGSDNICYVLFMYYY